MRKAILVTSLLLALLLNCLIVMANSPKEIIDPIKIRSTLNEHSSIKQLKIAFFNISSAVFKDPPIYKLNSIESIKFSKRINVSIGKIDIFKIKLSDDLPEVYDKNLVLIVDNFRHNAYFLSLDIVEPIKSQNRDTAYYFAGRYKRKEYGTFKVFDFINYKMKLTFSSPDYVSNDSMECICYANDDLRLQNADENGDGYLDLKFSGIKNYYCIGGENVGRLDRKPLKTRKIKFIYYYDPKHTSWHK